MNQWAFVMVAYVVTLGGTTVVTLWAWLAMRAAEKAAAR